MSSSFDIDGSAFAPQVFDVVGEPFDADELDDLIPIDRVGEIFDWAAHPVRISLAHATHAISMTIQDDDFRQTVRDAHTSPISPVAPARALREFVRVRREYTRTVGLPAVPPGTSYQISTRATIDDALRTTQHWRSTNIYASLEAAVADLLLLMQRMITSDTNYLFDEFQLTMIVPRDDLDILEPIRGGNHTLNEIPHTRLVTNFRCCLELPSDDTFSWSKCLFLFQRSKEIRRWTSYLNDPTRLTTDFDRHELFSAVLRDMDVNSETLKNVCERLMLQVCCLRWADDLKFYRSVWWTTQMNPREYKDGDKHIMFLLLSTDADGVDHMLWIYDFKHFVSVIGYCPACISGNQKYQTSCPHHDPQLLKPSHKKRKKRKKTPRQPRQKKPKVYIPMVFRKKRKDSFVRLNNSDLLCGARAIVIAMSYWHMKRESENHHFDEIRNDSNGFQTKEAHRIHRLAGVAVPVETGIGLTELKQFSDALGIDIFVIETLDFVTRITHTLRSCKFRQERKQRPLHLIPQCYLYYDKNHFDVVLRAHSILEGQVQCDFCFKVVSHKTRHVCSFRCDKCHEFGGKCKGADPHTHCERCNNMFYTQQCFDRHLKNKVCLHTTYCLDCKKRVVQFRGVGQNDKIPIRTLDDHKCGEFYCNMCKQVVIEELDLVNGHVCMLNRLKPPSDEKKTRNRQGREIKPKYYFFDLETYRTTPLADAKATIKPGIKFVHKVSWWELQDQEGVCFRGQHMKDLVDRLLKLKGQCTVFAHNGRGFDFLFVLKHMSRMKSFKKRPTMITAGTKVMQFELKWGGRNTLRFIDSLNHMQGRLASFPETFGIEAMDVRDELDVLCVSETTVEQQFIEVKQGLNQRFVQKGFYPYRFDQPENWNYIGPVPSQDMFDTSKMSSTELKTFQSWWSTLRDEEFVYNLKRERAAYCHLDVVILRLSVLKFRSLMMELSTLDPLQCTTIAQYALKVYRTFFMPENSICRYGMKDNRNFRKALHGGRTNCLKTYWKAQQGQQAHYYDVNSLYPSRQMFCNMPVGSPEHIVFEKDEKQETDLIQTWLQPEDWLSVMKIDVTPPNDLYIPVLPCKDDATGGKLLFDLQPKYEYWTNSVELKNAIRKGYVVNRVYEVYVWKETTKDMFSDYVRCFYKTKTEAAGWPTQDPESRQAFLTKILERVGVDIQFDDVKKNKGLKFVAKLLLNSLWGKLAQRENLTRTTWATTVNEEREMFEKMNELKPNGSLKYHYSSFVVMSELLSYFRYCFADSFDADPLEHVSVPVGVFVTAHARSQLYETLETLGERVLYFDTDSVIFYTKRNEQVRDLIPDLGCTLGEWENELNDGEWIDTFVSLGPKNYGYRVAKPDGTFSFCSKTKGIYVPKSQDHQERNFKCQLALSLFHTHQLKHDDPSVEKVFECPGDAKELRLTMNEKTNQLVFQRNKKRFLGDKFYCVYEKYVLKNTRLVADKRVCAKHLTFPNMTDSLPYFHKSVSVC